MRSIGPSFLQAPAPHGRSPRHTGRLDGRLLIRSQYHRAFAPALVGTERFLPACQAHADAIAGLRGPYESQVVESIVAEHGSIGRIDEKPRRRRDQEIAVGDAPAEQRIPCGLALVHVGIEIVAGEIRETLDVGKP